MPKPVMLLCLALFCFVWPSTALAQDPKKGEVVYQQKCVACHTIGKGALVGPDLKDVTTTRDPVWLARWIKEPDKLIAAKDPLALELLAQWKNVPMLNMGLTDTEVADIVAFLGGGAAAPAADAAPPVTILKGEATQGWAIFTGQTPLAQGGPPCISCHSMNGAGNLGGGTLGPELTQVFERYGGETGLASVLDSLPFPTMQPIYAGKGLTPEEQAHLRTLFELANTQATPDHTLPLVFLAVGGVVVLGAFAPLVWRRRLGDVRRTLLSKS